MNIRFSLSNDIYRVSILLLTIVITLWIGYTGSDIRDAHDSVPKIKAITPALYREWGKNSSIIKAGLYITNFSVVNMYENRFLFNGFIWIQFDPLIISLESVSQFSVDKGKLLEKELVDAKKTGDQLQVRYRVECEFVSVLNFKYYPFDSHRPYIVLRNDPFSARELFLMSDYTTTWFSSDALARNWVYNEPSCDFGYLEVLLDARRPSQLAYTPAVALYFDFFRSSLREAWLIFGPLVLILLAMLSLFLLSLSNIFSILLSLLGIIGILVHRMVVNVMSPTVVYYMLSDLVYLLVLFCAFLILISHMIIAMYRNEDTLPTQVMRSVALTVVSVVFLVGWVYLLRIW